MPGSVACGRQERRLPVTPDRAGIIVSTLAPVPALIPSRSPTLDDPTLAEPPHSPPGDGAPGSAPGLRAQIGATRAAAIALVRAHLDLARTEMGEIAGRVGRVIGLAALAIAVILFAGLLVVIGGSLFLAEWLLGSMGWGVLHGTLAPVGIAVAAGLLALDVPTVRLVRPLLVGLVVALAVGGVLGLELPNRLYRGIGESAGLAVDPAVRPLVVGLLVGALVGLVIGIAAALLTTRSGGGRIAAVGGSVVAGGLLGSFSAITFGPQVGAAVGITFGYLTWIALMGFDVVRTGVDTDALKDRFTPTRTIETSKETLEWLQKRMPPGIGS
jgi:hypothetical protein